ncbi:hypothetical protein NKH77_01180 [Streptomyces sp. M19]
MTATPARVADVRDGTCAGLPVHRARDMTWAWGTRTDRNTLDERCLLSASDQLPKDQTDDEKHYYVLEARYGTKALAEAVSQRRWSDATNDLRDRFRATASAPAARSGPGSRSLRTCGRPTRSRLSRCWRRSYAARRSGTAAPTCDCHRRRSES